VLPLHSVLALSSRSRCLFPILPGSAWDVFSFSSPVKIPTISRELDYSRTSPFSKVGSVFVPSPAFPAAGNIFLFSSSHLCFVLPLFRRSPLPRDHATEFSSWIYFSLFLRGWYPQVHPPNFPFRPLFGPRPFLLSKASCLLTLARHLTVHVT